MGDMQIHESQGNRRREKKKMTFIPVLIVSTHKETPRVRTTRMSRMLVSGKVSGGRDSEGEEPEG